MHLECQICYITKFKFIREMESEEKNRLLSGFPAHSYAEWHAAAVQLLKGRSFEKTLVTKTYEGFDLQPIYTREGMKELSHLGDFPGAGSRVRGSQAGREEGSWIISQALTAPTPADLNAILLKELENGQNELNIWLDRPGREGLDADSEGVSSVGVCGVSLSTVEDLTRLLKGVHPEMISLYLHGGAASPALYALLLASLEKAGVDMKGLKGCLGMDPIGWLVETGSLPGEGDKLHATMADLIRHAETAAPEMQILDVQGQCYHNGGSSSSMEMAAILATGVAYLKAMEAEGISAAVLAPRIRLSTAIGGDYFLEIAKIRALRLLWNRILEAFEVPEEARKIHVHAQTGLWNKTVFDPYVNMLRTTTEAFSAVVGGCDSLQIGTFDEIIRESDAFSRRIARNTHHILADECDMKKVQDPAGGSWAVETLTDQIAGEAWKNFQKIEASGGIVEALASGSLQDSVEAVRQEKLKNIQRRKDVIVGTNSYPNATEELLKKPPVDYAGKCGERIDTLKAWKSSRSDDTITTMLGKIRSAKGVEVIQAMVDAASSGATLEELHAALELGESEVKARSLELKRAAEEFESLRFAARELANSGSAPVIHQLNIGPSRRYRIRADWTSAFFQVAGFEILNTDEYDGVEEAIKALGESGSQIAVITSDDETYASSVETLARSIKQADAKVSVIVAGMPGDNEEAWRAAGVDDFVHVRVNNYIFNRKLLESLGASI